MKRADKVYRALGLQPALIPFTASRPRCMQSVNMVTDIDRTGRYSNYSRAVAECPLLGFKRAVNSI